MKNSFDLPPEGKILPFNKPVDWTSFDVVKKVRQLTGVKKVGHAGTLDPFATGLLLICLGPATKKSSALMDLPKEYVAEIVLGAETDTLDSTGTITSRAPVPQISAEQIPLVLEEFIGRIEQEIPAYSAAKFKGRRLYKLARQGKSIPTLYKKVEIYDLDLLDWGKDYLTIRVFCGRGTYVRALAKDIAGKFGTVGHLKSLVRTRIGDYQLKDALTIEMLQHQLKSTEIKSA